MFDEAHWIKIIETFFGQISKKKKIMKHIFQRRFLKNSLNRNENTRKFCYFFISFHPELRPSKIIKIIVFKSNYDLQLFN